MPNRTNVYPDEHLTHSFKGYKLFISEKKVKMYTMVNGLSIERERFVAIHRIPFTKKPGQELPHWFELCESLANKLRDSG